MNTTNNTEWNEDRNIYPDPKDEFALIWNGYFWFVF